MPISSTNRKAGPFAGDDVSTTFPFTFKAFSDADVEVVVADALGAESILTLTTDYTVDLNADQETSPGGDVVLNAPLATGTKLVATTKLAELQPVDFTNQGGFYPQVINQALDRLTIVAQQLRVDVDRSAKLPITRTEDADQLLSDVVLVADNMASVQTVGASIGSVNQVAAVDTEVTQVAAVAASVPVVAAVDTEVATVAGIAADVTTLAGISGNVTAVAANEINVNAVAAIATEVVQVAAVDAEVAQVAAAIPDIQAAVADLPSLAAKANISGQVFTGPVEVPAGAAGNQVPRASETTRKLRGASELATWNIAGRPLSPQQGDAGYNSDYKTIEVYDSTHGWVALSGIVIDNVSLSGAAVDLTGFPSWVTTVDVAINSASLSGTDAAVLIQLITSGGVIATSYVCTSGNFDGAGTAVVNPTLGFPIRAGNAAGHSVSSACTIKRVGDSWVFGHSGRLTAGTNAAAAGGGYRDSVGAITGIRITSSGANNLDAGTVSVTIRR